MSAIDWPEVAAKPVLGVLFTAEGVCIGQPLSDAASELSGPIRSTTMNTVLTRTREFLSAVTKLPGSTIQRAFESAARSGNESLLRLLLESPHVHVNGRSPSWGYTALHIAILERQTGAVELLLAASADVHMRDRGRASETPLHKAAFLGETSIVEKLLRAGASVDTKNANGQTAWALAGLMGGGSVLQKAECAARLQEWQAAPCGSPVHVCRGVAEEQAVAFYFQSDQAAAEQVRNAAVIQGLSHFGGTGSTSSSRGSRRSPLQQSV